MVSQGMGLVAARFAANVFELALRTSLTLTQVEVKTNGLVIGRARVHAPQGLRDGITSDLCFLAWSLIGIRGALLSIPGASASIALARAVFMLAQTLASSLHREQKVHDARVEFKLLELFIKGQGTVESGFRFPLQTRASSKKH